MYLDRILAGILIMSFLHIYDPGLGFAQAGHSDSVKQVTVHEPRVHKSQEKEISAKKGNVWLWVILGAVVVGGIVAAASGGSDSGGGSGSSDNSSGSVSGSW